MVRSGQVDQGQVFIDRIFKAGESPEGHLLMGLAYLNKQDYKSAMPELARAVELNPKLPSAHTLYGRALLGNGDQEAATRQFSLALDVNPNDFEANLQMGSIRHREQRDDDALVYLNRAAAIRPTDLVRAAIAGRRLSGTRSGRSLARVARSHRQGTARFRGRPRAAGDRVLSAEAEGPGRPGTGDRRAAQCREPGEAARREGR